jgi:tetratricopeptide (TPR) repeat protein
VAAGRGGAVIRKREPRWQSAAERARVAAELMEEAESLAEESTIASPADVHRATLPPPITVALPPEPLPPEALPLAPSAVAEPSSEPSPVPASLDDALAADPDNVALLVERARRLAAAAHYSAAQRDYERGLRGTPAHGEALTGLGILLSRRGLWGEAAQRLRRAAEVEPGRAGAWYYLGEALNHLDDLSGALAAYERAVELEPRNARALYGLGIVLDRLNRPDDATRMYRRSREAAVR